MPKNNLKPKLASLMTRTTRYMAEDGRERAVMCWDDYVRMTDWIKFLIANSNPKK